MLLPVGDAIYHILKSDPALTALVGTRIYPGPMPQTATFPAIIRWRTDRQEIAILESPGASQLVRYEYRLIAAAMGSAPESQADTVFRTMNKRLRTFGKGEVTNGLSPVATIWVEGIANARTMTELYNQQSGAWELGATYDFWVYEPLT